MSKAQLLYHLQQTDLEIEKTAGALSRVAEALTDIGALHSARQLRDALLEEVRQRKSKLKSVEWEVEDHSRRISTLDVKLYSGEVKNPKELSQMQHELEHLRELKRRTEDKELELLVDVEEKDLELQASENEVKKLDREWQAREAELRQEKAELEARLTEFQNKRARQVEGLESEDLGRYERLRAVKRGQAVSLVDREVCLGCRVAVPLVTIREARTSKGLVFCGSCGRILYVPR